MGYEIYKFQNSPLCEEPTISIDENDPSWAEAMNNWLVGKSPTNSTEWKKGTIVAISRKIPEEIV